MKFKVPYLIPRLNYSFSFRDILISIRGIFKSEIETKYLNELFQNEDIYYMNHARTGLRILLNSFNLKPNARIGVQIFNCNTVFNAIKIANFIPVFIDIDSDFRINIADLERKREKIDALIVTHTFGIPSDISLIKRIISDKPIIEDCAHAFLSRYNDKLVGMSGDASVFSIGKGKFPSIGAGGFVVINNRSIVSEFKKHYSRLQYPGTFYELKNILQNILLHFLHKKTIYRFFTKPIIRRLINKNGINKNLILRETKILKSNLNLFSCNYQYFGIYYLKQRGNFYSLLSAWRRHDLKFSVYSDNKITVNGFIYPILYGNADKLVRYFDRSGIEIGRHFSKSIIWAEKFGYKYGFCPNAEQYVNEVITFPCHYNYKFIKELISNYFQHESTH